MTEKTKPGHLDHAANDSILSVQCPTCQTSVTWDVNSKFRPFCSERCKLIDLGDWASENHKISGSDKDLMSDDLPDGH
jgi:endogenous inhibitor of DNA gyrase (YacG/DUF329 family)